MSMHHPATHANDDRLLDELRALRELHAVPILVLQLLLRIAITRALLFPHVLDIAQSWSRRLRP
jgi:hypothetical protein